MHLGAAFPQLLPLAVSWAERQQEMILAQGTPLSDAETTLARRVQVLRPDELRILMVDSIPVPDHPELKAACDQIGFLAAGTMGLTVGRGMFIRRGHDRDLVLMAHELRHAAQYERLGSIAAYVTVYVQELLQHGYDRAPFEVDACEAAARAVREG
jgi:hypothetical protein